MIETDIQQLALDIRNTLSHISEGKLNGHAALEKTLLLEKRFGRLRDSLKPDNGQNSLEGLCYNHNTENCSLLTGIFEINSEKSHCIAQFGGKELSDRIMPILTQYANICQEKSYSAIDPETEPLLKNTLHIYPFRKSGKSMIAVVSLSSSQLFDKGMFIHFGNFLDMLFPTGKDHPCGVIDTFHSIRSFIKRNHDAFDLHAQIYLFHDLDTIFSHAGTHTLFDVSASIEKQMSEIWGDQIPRFTISLKEYVIIVPEDKGHGKNDLLKSDFYYKGIPLPHISKSVTLDSEVAFYTFIDTLFSMSQP